MEERIMTERFIVDDCGTLIDMHTRDTFDYVSDVCLVLNKLVDENEQLKQENKGIQDKVWKLLELLEKEKGIDKRKIIDWWNGDVE